MSRKSLAPVLISVFTRSGHFEKCLESLKENPGAQRTPLFIVSDGPTDRESAIGVAAVRRIIARVRGFHEVTVVAPEENHKGLLKYQVLEEIRSSYPAYIVTEDDNVFSPHFLDFMNRGLDLFREVRAVRAICGYQYPGFPVQSDSQLYLRNFTPWGFGTWSDRSALPPAQHLSRQILAEYPYFKAINDSLPHLIRLNRRVVTENLSAEDVRITNHLFTNAELCVFPPSSLVRNIGNDGSGLNCAIDLRFVNQKLCSVRTCFDMGAPLEENLVARKWISSFLGRPFITAVNYSIYLEFRWERDWRGHSFRSINTLLPAVAGAVRDRRRQVRNYLFSRKLIRRIPSRSSNVRWGIPGYKRN